MFHVQVMPTIPLILLYSRSVFSNKLFNSLLYDCAFSGIPSLQPSEPGTPPDLTHGLAPVPMSLPVT